MNTRGALSFLLLVLLASTAQAQEEVEVGWDGPRALELIERAQARRMEAHADTGLINYQADARIYVYFYLDREDTGTRNLVKTDQVALELFWEAPDLVKQRIVGWRDEKSLPTNINYHLDHLTVVMENFGDEIRLGDGDEVQGVPHPAAPAAESFYEYRLADSLTLRLPGVAEPLRVYEIQVRPRDLSQPGFLGSVYVDRRTGDLVRMDFTFTPSAYRDPYLDYINISLDNGLWKGRFWLPNEQRVEIRRRLPILDVPAGSVIRATIRVRDYQFNQVLPVQTFSGPQVVTVPREQRESFAFEQDLHEEVREEGLGNAVEMDEIRQQAEEIARERALSGVSTFGLSARSASEVFRYNRTEGPVLGIGMVAPIAGEVQARGYGAWAFGAEHAIGEIAIERETDELDLALALFANRPRQVGVSGASGVGATLSALFAASDPLDLYYTNGIELRGNAAFTGGWNFTAALVAERQRSAEQSTSFSFFGDGFRPVNPIDVTDRTLSGSVGISRVAPDALAQWWSGSVEVEAVTGEPKLEALGRYAYLRPVLQLAWGRRFAPLDSRLELTGRAGAALGEIPQQALFLIGGRAILPGYPLHAYAGDRLAVAGATASAEVGGPWLRARLKGALGWTGVGGAGEDALTRWGASTTDGVKASAGVGAGLFLDLLHVDVVRGLGEHGRWEVIVDASQGFWDFL